MAFAMQALASQQPQELRAQELRAQELRGIAVAVGDGRVLYTEYHRWHDDSHTAEYRAPDGKLLATNEIDYSPGRSQPAFVQTTIATGRAEGARWQGEVLTLFRGDDSKVVDYSEPLVINAGFNHFVLQHWDELQRNQSFTVDFAAPHYLRVVRLKVQRIDAEKTHITHADPHWFFLRVRAANPILAWFVAPVDLAYSDDRKLRVYRGTSNIEIAGKLPAVEVRY